MMTSEMPDWLRILLTQTAAYDTKEVACPHATANATLLALSRMDASIPQGISAGKAGRLRLLSGFAGQPLVLRPDAATLTGP